MWSLCASQDAEVTHAAEPQLPTERVTRSTVQFGPESWFDATPAACYCVTHWSMVNAPSSAPIASVGPWLTFGSSGAVVVVALDNPSDGMDGSLNLHAARPPLQSPRSPTMRSTGLHADALAHGVMVRGCTHPINE